MDNNLYKQTAVELFIKKVRDSIPELEDWQLKAYEYAFESGFNMGVANYESKEIKELALKMMIK